MAHGIRRHDAFPLRRTSVKSSTQCVKNNTEHGRQRRIGGDGRCVSSRVPVRTRNPSPGCGYYTRAPSPAGTTKKCSLYNMMYVLARKSGAQGWGSGLALGIDDNHSFRAMGRQVFPRATVVSTLRQKHGVKGAGRLARDIANAAFSLGHAAGSGGSIP